MGYNDKHPAQLATELDTVLTTVGAKARLPTFSVDVDVSGTRISRAYRDGSRRVTGEERPVFASGCLGDIFLALVCLELYHARGFDLDAPFETIVPELGSLEPDAEPITLRQLLTRTSGIQDPRTIHEMSNYVSWEDLSVRMRDSPRLFSPGSVFNYGGIDRLLLGAALHRFSGMPVNRLAREIVVDPANLAIRDIQFGPPQEDGFRPIQFFDTTTFLDIMTHLTPKLGAPSDALFSEGIRDDLQAEQLQLSRALKVQPWPHAPTAFTCGLFKYSDGLIGFNGWEQNQSLAVRLDPPAGVSFVVAVEGPPVVRDVIVAQIAELLGYTSVQSRAVPCTVGGLNGLAPKDIAGTYSGWADGYQADVTVDQKSVACELSYRGERFRRVRARVEEDSWLVADSPAGASAFEFFRDDRTGRVCFASGFLPYARLEAA